MMNYKLMRESITLYTLYVKEQINHKHSVSLSTLSIFLSSSRPMQQINNI
jgi:hypothetical protein